MEYVKYQHIICIEYVKYIHIHIMYILWNMYNI